MFPIQELQHYSIPVDEKTMGTFDWIDHALVAHGEDSSGPSKVTPNKAAILSAQKKVIKYFGKIRIE